jgi:hypothetical protein
MMPKTSRCRTCGNVQRAGSFFCGECGNSILSSAELAPSAITDTRRLLPLDRPDRSESSSADEVPPVGGSSTTQPEIGAFVLQFSTGDSFPVTGHGFMGRNPVSASPGGDAQLVRIVDPALTVSKAHLEFGIEEGRLWITDLRSGNGTIIEPVDASPWRAHPGTRYEVSRGWRIRVGEQYFDIG